jgi:heterodisulfide reductase subunit A-like polyferredoxin
VATRKADSFISRAVNTGRRVKEWTGRVLRTAGNAALIAGVVAGIAAMLPAHQDPKPPKSPKRAR